MMMEDIKLSELSFEDLINLFKMIEEFVNYLESEETQEVEEVKK
jgi:hypothetical protein